MSTENKNLHWTVKAGSVLTLLALGASECGPASSPTQPDLDAPENQPKTLEVDKYPPELGMFRDSFIDGSAQSQLVSGLTNSGVDEALLNQHLYEAQNRENVDNVIFPFKVIDGEGDTELRILGIQEDSNGFSLFNYSDYNQEGPVLEFVPPGKGEGGIYHNIAIPKDSKGNVIRNDDDSISLYLAQEVEKGNGEKEVQFTGEIIRVEKEGAVYIDPYSGVRIPLPEPYASKVQGLTLATQESESNSGVAQAAAPGTLTPFQPAPTTPAPIEVPTEVSTESPTATEAAEHTATQEPELNEEQKLDILKRAGFTPESWAKQSKEKLGPLADEVVYPLTAKRGELMPIEVVNNSDSDLFFKWGYEDNGKIVYNNNIWRVAGVVSQIPYTDKETGEVFSKVKTLDKNGNLVELNVSFWKPQGWGGQTSRSGIPLGNSGSLTGSVTVKYPERIFGDVKKGMMVIIDLPDSKYGVPDISADAVCENAPDYCQQWTEWFKEREDFVFPKYLPVTEKVTDELLNGDLKDIRDARLWVMNIFYSTGW